MEHLDTALDEFCIVEEAGRTSTGRMGRRSYRNDDKTEGKSKNLFAERRRRQKLSDRLLKLRALVPRITNMNKATIIEDAITYIEELQKNVMVLQEQLCELEASSEEAANPAIKVEVEAAEDMKQSGIQVEVEVTEIDRDKLWVKIIFEKKRCGFTTLMEAMSAFGFEFINTNLITSKGAMLVSSCVKGIYGQKLAVQPTRELILEIINGVESNWEYS